ncbi:hypothetical protein LWI29_020479 [Acer saccharum]|uniref:C-JID domain-containing protein n=1 Tax=Acer saccharum TaxID=4024 RepID=A0AA39SWA0_ACESA|nr:hypothetical protein LWI29_020479 [Acer saccharum]
MDCEQLCQVPDASEFVRCINSKSHHSTYYHPIQFIFANSLNLKAAVSNVFEESLRLMQRIKKESGKPSNQFYIYLPGNKIPEWFSGQSPAPSVKIRVLRNDLVNRKVLGFAICAVLRVDEYNSRCVRLSQLHSFHCKFKIFPDDVKIANDWTYLPSNIIIGPNIFIDSEHLLLGYCSFDSLSQNPTMLPGNDYLNILIEFGYKCGCNGPKRCAVHPIYAEEPLEIIGATIQEIVETSGRRSDRSDENDEECILHSTIGLLFYHCSLINCVVDFLISRIFYHQEVMQIDPQEALKSKEVSLDAVTGQVLQDDPDTYGTQVSNLQQL